MQLDTAKAYLLLGTNLGDRKLNLEKSIERIKMKVGDVFAISSVYETEPWGNTNQPGFLNQAVGVNTKLSPQELIKEVLGIEKELGRVRFEKWGQRLIDIDIIFYGDQIVDEQDLKLPHPLMHERKFVLVPLNEIAEEIIHPVFKQKISSILANLSDELLVNKFTD